MDRKDREELLLNKLKEAFGDKEINWWIRNIAFDLSEIKFDDASVVHQGLVTVIKLNYKKGYILKLNYCEGYDDCDWSVYHNDTFISGCSKPKNEFVDFWKRKVEPIYN